MKTVLTLALFLGGMTVSGAVHRPETWFHLIGGNVSAAGLEADLDAIKAAGIGGIQLFHGQYGKAETWPGGGAPVKCLSPEWEKMIRVIADGCVKRGLSFRMQNCPGWSMSGGPWVSVTNAMRNLSYSRTDVVSDGGMVDVTLPMPGLPRPEVAISETDRDYRDLFVLAFPTPEGDGEEPLVNDVKGLSCEDGSRIYRFGQPTVVRTTELPSPAGISVGRAYEPHLSVKLEAESSSGSWISVAERDYPQGCWQDDTTFSVACDEVPARAFRVTFSGKKGKVPFVRLLGGARRDNWEGLAAWTLRGLVRDNCVLHQGEDAWVRLDSVMDLTDVVCDPAHFDWYPPHKGKWTILRIGHVNAGLKNAPAPAEATGWECDKLDPAGIDCVFDGYIGHLAKGSLRGKLDGAILDSWECRRQTWTPKMEAYFRAANGYDIRRFLPAVFGWVIDDPARTERVLLDWRRTIGDLCEKNYYGRFAERCHAAGLTADFETAFGDVFPGDLMAFWKHADVPMCEFWSPHGGHFLGCDEFKPVRPCVSAARVYSKSRVAAESFTVMGKMWFEDFLFFKEIANRYFARGITHLVFHTYTHNPATDGSPPGTSFGAEIGRPFLRGQTWWPYLKELTGYFTRCCERLERGQPASDILWYLGDDLGHKPSERSPFGNRYQYDYLNYDALMTRISVWDGEFMTPEGVSWHVLWVPNVHLLRDDTREKLAALSAAGGRVVCGDASAAVAGLSPDCMAWPENEVGLKEEDPIDWLHRREDGRDVYFVSTLQPEGFTGRIRFRAKGPARLYDAVTDEELPAEVTAADDAGVEIRLKLLRGESRFVMIGGSCCQRQAALPERVDCEAELPGPWTISFPSGWGAPELIETSVLKPWKELPLGEEGRAFSGTATYRTSFTRPSPDRVWLDLGDVAFIADVRVNERPVRVLWAPPYRCEMTEFLVPGENTLEVKVTSNWYNRLVYDAGLPENERKTWTIAAPKSGSPLCDSGLLGLVKLTWGR